MSVVLNTCGNSDLDFFQLLAGSMVVDAQGVVSFRAIINTTTCDAVTPFVTCDNKDQSPMDLVKFGFVIDDCGRIAMNFTSLTT